MIKSIFRWLFSEPASQQNEIELRNAIIGALTQHLNRLGHPVEAVRIPSHAMPNRHGSTFTNTFFGASNLRLIAGLDVYGLNVITGRTASATATSSTLSLVGHAASEWLGRGEPWTGEVAATCRDAERDFGRPSPALSPTWAEASRAYNDGLDRAAPIGVGTRAHLAAKLHDAGLEAEARAEHAQNLAAVLRAGDAAAVRQAEADALAAMTRKGAK